MDFGFNFFLRLSYRPRLIYGWLSPSPSSFYCLSRQSPFLSPILSLFSQAPHSLIFVFLALPVPLAVRTINLTHYIRIVISPVVGVGLPRR
jgi:hypothetical protein